MKHLVIILICILGAISSGRSQGLIFNSGDSYTYTFSNFTFQAAGSTGPRAQVSLTFSNFAQGDSFIFYAYENSLFETPLFVTNFTSDSGIPLFQLGPAWQDFQGVFKIDMVAGSMTLLDFVGSVVTANGDYYSEKPLVIPEPTTHFLLGTGLVVLLVFGGFRRVRRSTESLSASDNLRK